MHEYGAMICTKVRDGKSTVTFVDEMEVGDREMRQMFRRKEQREAQTTAAQQKEQRRKARQRAEARGAVFDALAHIGLGIGILFAAQQSLTGYAFALATSGVCFILAAIRLDRIFGRRKR